MELEVGVETHLRKPRLAVGVEEPPIPVIGDAPAVLHVADLVVDDDPVDRPALGLDVVQVVLHELHRRGQVRLVELVRHVEAERAKLAPLLHDRVHEAEREEHNTPLRLRIRVEHVLVDPSIRALETSLDARRSLIGHLDRHLQQPNRELGMRLCRDPQTEGVHNLGLELDQPLLHLDHEADAEVAVLEHNPVARGDGGGQ
mmetsp:Transcript_25027/g.54625  ORF Transcript_25027/g.54625 Transcript_25027/m.54625 type:complete len:201 (+) Transcript_25027:1527-2129(+)